MISSYYRNLAYVAAGILTLVLLWPRTGSLASSPIQAATASASFAIGAGVTGSNDVIPHQIVRTNQDRLYILTTQQDSNLIRVYWTPAAGLPNVTGDFALATSVAESGTPISLDAVYDGGNFIHAIVNTQAGQIRDYPLDVTTNQFKPAITLATDGGVPAAGGYIGTSGISGMFDPNGVLHLAYWSNGNHIVYRAQTYNSAANTLTLTTGPTILDSAGNANHASLALSPLDNSLTIAWVYGKATTDQGRIAARTRSSAGVWQAEQTVSAVRAWTDTSSGVNIDQGPSLLIDANGVRHLGYIENWRISQPYDYGRIHYVTNSGSGWNDQYIGAYTHDPALALNSSGELYIIGHGHPQNPAGCQSMDDMCTIKKNADGTWGTPQLFLAHTGQNSFDSSPSVKWSVVGWNRSDLIEFVFFQVPPTNGYSNPTEFYARLGATTSGPTPTVSATAASTATSTPSSTGTPTATRTPSPTAPAIPTATPCSPKKGHGQCKIYIPYLP